MGSRNRLAPSPTANPPSPMPVPQQMPAQAAVLEQAPQAAGFDINELPGSFNPAFFGRPVSSGTGNPFEVSGQQQFKIPQMGGQIGQGGPQVGQVGQGGPNVGGKCPTCGK